MRVLRHSWGQSNTGDCCYGDNQWEQKSKENLDPKSCHSGFKHWGHCPCSSRCNSNILKKLHSNSHLQKQNQSIFWKGVFFPSFPRSARSQITLKELCFHKDKAKAFLKHCHSIHLHNIGAFSKVVLSHGETQTVCWWKVVFPWLHMSCRI